MGAEFACYIRSCGEGRRADFPVTLGSGGKGKGGRTSSQGMLLERSQVSLLPQEPGEGLVGGRFPCYPRSQGN